VISGFNFLTQMSLYAGKNSFAADSIPIQASSKQNHIAFLLTDGFAARMMVRSGIASRLVDHQTRVTVISPNADEAYFRRECEKDGIEVKQEPKSTGRIAHWFRIYRSYLLDNVMVNPTLRSWHIQRKEKWPVYSFVMELVNRSLARAAWFRNLSRAVERRLNRSRRIRQFLTELNPDLLVLPNPFGVEETVYLLHARELGIPVVCQMLSWDNITSKGTPLLMPDYFVSWGSVMTEEMVQIYGFPRKKIYECGVPHFDTYYQKTWTVQRNALLRELNLPPDQPYIFYGMVAEIYCPNELEILEWLADKVDKGSFVEACSLIIRPHPLTLSGEYASNSKNLSRLKSLTGARVVIDIPPVQSEKLAWDLPKSDMRRLATLLAGSAICINASSTLCLDACMLDRPVINIGFDGREERPYERSARQSLDFTHMHKVLSFGGIRIARSFGELQEHINSYLSNPDLDREARVHTALRECGFRDGKAAERVAHALLQLVS
jgi:CDP-glycerol glycerophosphotransferase (TagB/SpsB family)